MTDPEQVERLWFWRTSDVGPVEWIRSTSDPGPSSRPDYECIEVVPASALEAAEERERELEAAIEWRDKQPGLTLDLIETRECERDQALEREERLEAKCRKRGRIITDLEARVRELQEQRDSYERGGQFAAEAFSKCKAERDQALARAQELEEGQLIQVTALHKAKAERDEALTALRELVEATHELQAGMDGEDDTMPLVRGGEVRAVREALNRARFLLGFDACGKPTVQAGTDGFCTRPRGHEGPCITV